MSPTTMHAHAARRNLAQWHRLQNRLSQSGIKHLSSDSNTEPRP